jgi:hypothetical protein
MIGTVKLKSTFDLNEAFEQAKETRDVKFQNTNRQVMSELKAFTKLPKPVEVVASAVFDTLALLKEKPSGIAQYTQIILSIYPAVSAFDDAIEAIKEDNRVGIKLAAYGSYRVGTIFGPSFLKSEANNTLGIETIGKVQNVVLDLYITLYNALKDGIDISDLGALVKLVPMAENLTEYWEQFIAEMSDLTPYELAVVGNDFGQAIYDILRLE